MATTVTKYKIYCDTEAAYVSGWGTAPPTECYNNDTHTVNANSIQIMDIVSNNEVLIKEDKITIGRNIKIKEIVLEDVEKNTSKTVIYTFNFITSMYSFKYISDDTNKGDQITIAINPNTNFGYITQDVEIGDTVIHVPAVMLIYISNGFNANLYTGVITENLGLIKSVDKINNTITVSTPSTQAFSAASTFIRATYYVMEEMTIGSAGLHDFGNDVVGGAAVPVGTVAHFIYKNNAKYYEVADEPKSLVIYFTLLF